MNFIEFFMQRFDSIMKLTIEHLIMVSIAMAVSVSLGILVGVVITYNENAARVVLNIAEVLMTIPSLALFAVLIPIFHIGPTPAIIGLVLYTQLPIIRNVYTGIKNIDPSIIE